jgi:hypothetical protein
VTVFPACITRQEVRAYTWLNNGLPADLCEREPRLQDHGFYRRLNDGRLEFISFCQPNAKDWIGIHRQDFEDVLDKLLPEKRRKGK